jgi:hypothetical protein
MLECTQITSGRDALHWEGTCGIPWPWRFLTAGPLVTSRVVRQAMELSQNSSDPPSKEEQYNTPGQVNLLCK